MDLIIWGKILVATVLSSLLYVILKFFQRFRIYNLHGLTFNYLTASSLSYISYSISGNNADAEISPIAIYAFLIGSLFISVFYIAALTAQRSGVAVTSIAGKMSMVIPIIAGLWLYDENLSGIKMTGILLALISVFLSSYKPSRGEYDSTAHQKSSFIYPVLLFIGSGLVDTSIKISEHFLITDENEGLYVSMLFGSAGIIGLLITLYKQIFRGIKIEPRGIAGGIILGTVNYYSLVFLINVLAEPGLPSSLAFSLVNVLVVLISALFALLLFREKLSAMNTGGLILAIISIIILSN